MLRVLRHFRRKSPCLCQLHVSKLVAERKPNPNLIMCVYVFLHVFLVGIGRDIVKALQKGGAKAVAISRSKADLDSLKEEVYNVSIVFHNLIL